MKAYSVAFERQDADAAAALFTPDAAYQWGPFGELLRGPDEIRARWEQASDPRAEPVTFDYEVIAVTDTIGVARWLATHSYPSEGKRFRYDGIFEVALDGDGRSTSFREWWNTREEPLEAAPLTSLSEPRADRRARPTAGCNGSRRPVGNAMKWVIGLPRQHSRLNPQARGCHCRSTSSRGPSTMSSWCIVHDLFSRPIGSRSLA